MSIEGSVSQSASAGANTVTLPASDLTIVGIYAGTYYMSIVLNAGENAIIPINTPSRNVQPVTFKPGTNSITYSVPTACTAVFYYGTPLPGAKPLSVFKGVVATESPTAAGTGTFTMAFPKASNGRMTGEIALLSASTTLFTFNSAVGKTISFQEFTGEFQGIEFINPVNLPLSNSLTVTYTSQAAQTFYFVLYYS